MATEEINACVTFQRDAGEVDRNKQEAAEPLMAGQGDQPATVKSKNKKSRSHKQDWEENTIYLYQFCRTAQLPSISPFCLKVETFLRLAEFKYENVDHKMKLRSRKGQLPFVELNGEEIADSTIILKVLGQQYGKDMDACLSKDQKNLSHATICMIENHLVWVVAWWRTKYPDDFIKGSKINLQHAFGTRIPNGVLNFFFKFSYARKGGKKVKAVGIGRDTAEQIVESGQEDLKVLSNMLADKPFFFGNTATTLDVVAFACLAQICFIDKEVQFCLRDYIQKSCSNLEEHVNRMKEKYFPDWEEMCSTLDLNTHLPEPPAEEKENKEEEKKKTEDNEGANEIEKETEVIEKPEKEEKQQEYEAVAEQY